MSWHTKDWTRLIAGLAAATAVAGSGGLLGPEVAGMLGASGAAGAGAASAADAAVPLLGEGAGLGAGAAAGGAAATAASSSPGFLSLLGGSTLGKAATGAGINAAMSAATPQTGMTTPGQIPQMTPPDPTAELQELMKRKSKLGGTF